jgi:hypothetical protein
VDLQCTFTRGIQKDLTGVRLRFGGANYKPKVFLLASESPRLWETAPGCSGWLKAKSRRKLADYIPPKPDGTEAG